MRYVRCRLLDIVDRRQNGFLMFRTLRRNIICMTVLAITGTSAATANAGDQVDRLVAAVEGAGHHVPPTEKLRQSCDQDLMCIARFLRDRIGEGAELVPSDGPSDSRTSWQSPSTGLMTVTRADGMHVLVIRRYDPDAILAAVKNIPGGAAVALDLRSYDGPDDLDAMRRTAALFTGRVPRAFGIRHFSGRLVDWTIQAQATPALDVTLQVWIGPANDAVSSLFAVLLRDHAGARLLGQQTRASDHVRTRIPVTPGWALAVPTGRLSVPGADLASGVLPDGNVPPS